MEAVAAKLNGTPQTFGAQLNGGVRWRGTDDGAYRRALEVAGLLTLPKDIPVWRITPRDLWVLLAGREMAVAA